MRHHNFEKRKFRRKAGKKGCLSCRGACERKHRQYKHLRKNELHIGNYEDACLIHFRGWRMEHRHNGKSNIHSNSTFWINTYKNCREFKATAFFLI